MSFMRGLQGGASMAATGASVGAVFGGAGAPIGAAIGGIAGFASGLFGGGGGSSGGTGAGKKTKQALKIQNDLTLESLQKDAALAIQANEKAAILYDDLRDAKYAEELKNYEIAVEQRAENYELARKAYEDSVDAFDETVDLNNISASMAMNDARRVYNERRQELNMQGRALTHQLEAGKRDFEIDKTLIQRQLASSLKQAQLNTMGINTNLRSALRDGGDAIKESTRKFETATQLAQLDNKIRNIQLGADKKIIKSQMATLEGEKTSIIATADLQQSDILNSLSNTIAESDFAAQTLRLAQDEKYAEAAIQTDQLRRKGLLEQSAQLAKGQAGRSAGKAVQGMAFANQQAQALIASALVRADSKYLIDKNSLAQSLVFARQQGQSGTKQVSIGLNKSASQFKSSALQMGAKRQELGIRGVEANKAKKTLQDQMQQTMFSNKNITNKFGDAKKLAAIDLEKLSTQVMQQQAEAQTKILKNETNYFDLQTQAKLSFESLALAGESLSSELKINNERIQFDKMLANRAAESQVLDMPRLPDLLPPPIKAPPLIQQPLPDIDWKKIEKSMDKARKAKMSYNPSGLSDFTTMMTNINGIAQQAASIANSFKPAPNVQQPVNHFPTKQLSQVNTPQGVYQNEGLKLNMIQGYMDQSSTPLFGTDNNLFGN